MLRDHEKLISSNSKSNYYVTRFTIYRHARKTITIKYVSIVTVEEKRIKNTTYKIKIKFDGKCQKKKIKYIYIFVYIKYNWFLHLQGEDFCQFC